MLWPGARRVGVMLDARSFHPARRAVGHLRMLAGVLVRGAGLPLARADEVLGLVGLISVAAARPAPGLR
ncbi:hypothetical protein GCM10010499_34960 [Streptomyces thermoviolaceus subsp. apingens]|nr:hypothetical protein GCM10010499_34960 [Streptomyces thermoviolaceus subsp. apingens]